MSQPEEELVELLREIRDAQREHFDRLQEFTKRDLDFQTWVREQSQREAEYRRSALRQQRVIVLGLLALGAFFVFQQALGLPFP